MPRHLPGQFSNGYMEPFMDVYDRQTRLGSHNHHPQMRDRLYGMSSRPNPRTDPMLSHRSPRSQNMPQPPPLLGSSGTGGQPRRRIPVACARCRKRKIKCTGDLGDNTGCTNCKQARVPQGSCVFLRVSSNNLDLGPQTTSSNMNNVVMHHSISSPSLHSAIPSHQSCRSSHHSGMQMHGGMDSKNYFASNTDPGLLSGGGRYDSPSLLMSSRSYDNLGHHDLSSFSGSVNNASNAASNLYNPPPPYMLQSTEDASGHNSQVHPSLQQHHPHQQPEYRHEWPLSTAGTRGPYNPTLSPNYGYLDLNNPPQNLASPYNPSGTGSSSISRSLVPSSNVSPPSVMATPPTTSAMENFPVFPALSILHSSLPTSEKSLPPLTAGSKTDYTTGMRSFDTYRPTNSTYDSTTPGGNNAHGNEDNNSTVAISSTSVVTAGQGPGASTPPLSTTPNSSISRSSSRISLTSGTGGSSTDIGAYTTSTSGIGYQYVNAQGQEVRGGAGDGAAEIQEPRRMAPVSTLAGAMDNDGATSGRGSFEERRDMLKY